MRPHCCHVSFAFLLKFLNFLQAFMGVSIVLYSLWMLNQWNHHIPIAPPPAPLAPSPDFSISLSSHALTVSLSDHKFVPLKLTSDIVSGFDPGLDLDLNSFKLPTPWFIYSFMGVGIVLCIITLVGCIAAEAIHGCCLCFYAILVIVLILLEAALVAFLAIDGRWEKDLPFDPTGELDNLRSFIECNVDICKWIGVIVVAIQASSLLLAIVLRAMVSTRKSDPDEDDCETARGRTWEPLLNPQASQAGSTKGDIWSSRIREKYGLNSGDKYNSPK